MILEKTIVFILVLVAVADTFFQVQLCYTIYEYTRQPNTFAGDIYSNTHLLLRVLIDISAFIGIYKLIKNKSIELVYEFKFLIFYIVITTIFWHLLLLLSKDNSLLHSINNGPWYKYALSILNIALVILVCIYFFFRTEKKVTNAAIPTSPKARFINWIIDISVISLFTISHFKNFQHELILQEYFTQRESIQLFFILNAFLYYFVLESVFLQTIGKLHNNSFVEYSGNRFKSILIRTLCRFIPFEAFTCFGNKGWHDLISKTKVVVFKREL